MRVLVVGNEDGSVRVALTAYHHRVIDCRESNTDAALQIIEDGEVDLVLIEIGPHTQATHLVQRMRLAKVRAPVLLLSSIDYLTQTVRALSAGADDYIALPFDPESMIKRCFDVSEEYHARALPALVIGRLEINLERRTLHVDGARVHLTIKEFQMLELLSINHGTMVTKDTFVKHIYHGRYEPVPKIVDVFICKLRKKLVLASGENYVGTVWGRGYILRAPQAASDGSNRAVSA